MNAAEAVEFIEAALTAHYPNQWQQVLLPEAHAWSLRRQDVLSALHVGDQGGHVMITVTAGVGLEVPSERVSAWLNEQNAQLVFGRLFSKPNAGGTASAVVMQEILPTMGMSWNFQPSLEQAMFLIGSLTARAEVVAQELRSDLGGRRFNDDEAFLLLLLGD